MRGIEFLETSEVKDFIQHNLNSDIQKLLLNPLAEFGPNINEIVNQIQARQKAKGKLGSWVGNFDLIFPPPLSVEQASSEKTATYKKSLVKGEHLIDLTGGMGVDTLALSENFDHTTYVEQQPELAQVFEHNQKVLGSKKIEVISEEAASFLEKFKISSKSGTAFYIDPARRNKAKGKVFNLEDCSPNIIELLPLLRRYCKQVLIKLSPFLDIKLILEKIGNVRELHVVSVKNECKELLVLVDFTFDSEPIIKTINLDNTNQIYNFTFSEEQDIKPSFNNAGRYLLESNASILKSGAFNKVSLDFSVTKLHPNTHLYSSESPIEGWPGRTFEILESKFDKKLLPKYATNQCMNVLTRNYPTNAASVKKKFKLKDGGDFFLIGFSGIDKKSHLVVAKKIEESKH